MEAWEINWNIKSLEDYTIEMHFEKKRRQRYPHEKSRTFTSKRWKRSDHFWSQPRPVYPPAKYFKNHTRSTKEYWQYMCRLYLCSITSSMARYILSNNAYVIRAKCCYLYQLWALFPRSFDSFPKSFREQHNPNSPWLKQSHYDPQNRQVDTFCVEMRCSSLPSHSSSNPQ